MRLLPWAVLAAAWAEVRVDEEGLPKEATIRIPKSVLEASKKKKKPSQDFPLSWNIDAAQRYKLFQEDPIDGVDRGGPPKPEDARDAMALAEDVQCEVCKTILRHLLEGRSGARKLTRDVAMDLLEGEIDKTKVEAAADRDELNIQRSRRGCNRHFKDSYMAKGWDVRDCVKFPKGADPKTERHKGVPGLCAWQAPKVPNETEMATYALEKEAIFYACQHTVGKYSDELADFLSEEVPASSQPLKDLVGEACRSRAKCLERKHSLSIDRRVVLKQQALEEEKERSATGAKGARRKRRRRRRAAGQAEARREL